MLSRQDNRECLSYGGVVICVSGPSGVGKGTVIHELREQLPNLLVSVSVTTRSPRPGERHGIEYYFNTRDEFEAMLSQKQILEHDVYCGNYYGTPRQPIDEAVRSGKNIILDITVPGALEVKRNYPQACTVFLLPPSMEALAQRLNGRGTEPEDVMAARLAFARNEIRQANRFDYVLENREVRHTADNLHHIILAERARTPNILSFEEYLKSL